MTRFDDSNAELPIPPGCRPTVDRLQRALDGELPPAALDADPGLATARPAMLLEARDGTFVEIFEWVPGGAERAHHDPRVMGLWDRFSAACDFVALRDLPDAERPFPHFRAVDGVTA